MIEQAGRADGKSSRDCLIQFLQQYMVPMRVHLEMRFGMNAERARDIVQSFIADKVLERKLLASADRRRGSRFRTFLLTSLDRYAAQRRDYDRAAKRCPERMFRFEDIGDPVDWRGGSEGDHVFAVEWARKILAESMTRMCMQCMARGRMDIWRAFQQRLWLPISTASSPPSYRALAVQLGLGTAIQAANLTVTAKRMFERHLREIIGEYCTSDEEIDAEVADLCQIVARPCA